MVIQKMCCLGAGYVGGPTSCVFALKCPDIEVTVCDIDAQKISKWNSDKLPIYEPDLDDIVKSCRGRNLFFSNDYANAIKEADLIFISVNTPTKTFGCGKGKAVDLQNLEHAARMIAENSEGNKIVIEKSTVPVRAVECIVHILKANKMANVLFHVLSNPEFLSEGSAVHDLLYPERVLIGGDNSISAEAINELCLLYERWIPKEKILRTNTWSSELSKLAANAMLAQRVSSINSLSAICEVSGADISQVSQALGKDTRIGSKFLQAFIGFGGRNFQKDVLSLVYMCECLNLPEVAAYWKQVVDMNAYQKKRFSSKILKAFFNTIMGKHIALFGFAFKKGTSDTSDSPAIYVANYLLTEGAVLHIYDPQVEEAKIFNDLRNTNNNISIESLQKRVNIFSDPYSAAKAVHAIVVCTQWDVFATLNYNKIYNTMMKPAFIFDGGRVLDHPSLMKIGFHVETIGKGLKP